MILNRLELLYNSMTSQGITRCRFSYRLRHLQFSIIFLADYDPMELLFGCHAENIFFTSRVWKKNFALNTYLGDAYLPLVRALGLKPDPSNPYSPKAFFEEFNKHIPGTTTPRAVPTQREIAENSKDIEDSEKIYFFGWIMHDGKTSKPRVENLEKTKRICGIQIYEVCKLNLISSRWTEDAEKAIAFYLPTIKS